MITTPDLRRVLSIKQPWASLIIRPDLPECSRDRLDWLRTQARKNVENRTWSTAYRGPLWIHAGLDYDLDGLAALWENMPSLRPFLRESAPGGPHDLRGGIIGKATLIDVVQANRSIWFAGPHGWLLGAPEIVKFEPMKGMQGLFHAGSVPLGPPRKRTAREEARLAAKASAIMGLACETCDGTGEQGEMPCSVCHPMVQSRQPAECYYHPDGTLRNPDGTRSTFCDVDA